MTESRCGCDAPVHPALLLRAPPETSGSRIVDQPRPGRRCHGSIRPATEIPVGVITALLGGPFFIYLLIHGRRSGRMWGSER